MGPEQASAPGPDEASILTKLARSVKKFRDVILNAIAHRLSNSLIESVNAKIRLITRIAFGFKNVDALIALAMLSLGGHRPVLPGRN